MPKTSKNLVLLDACSDYSCFACAPLVSGYRTRVSCCTKLFAHLCKTAEIMDGVKWCRERLKEDRLLLIAVIKIFSPAIFSCCLAAGNLYLCHSKRNRNAVRARTYYECVKFAPRTSIRKLCVCVCVWTLDNFHLLRNLAHTTTVGKSAKIHTNEIEIGWRVRNAEENRYRTKNGGSVV